MYKTSILTIMIFTFLNFNQEKQEIYISADYKGTNSPNIKFELDHLHNQYKFVYFVPQHPYESIGLINKINDTTFLIKEKYPISHLPIAVNEVFKLHQNNTQINIVFLTNNKLIDSLPDNLILVINDSLEMDITKKSICFPFEVNSFFIKSSTTPFLKSSKFYSKKKSNFFEVNFEYTQLYEFYYPIENDTLIYCSGKYILWNTTLNNKHISVELSRITDQELDNFPYLKNNIAY